MARKKGYPTKSSSSGNDGQLLKENNVERSRMERMSNSIMRDMMSIILEGALDQEMDGTGIFQV